MLNITSPEQLVERWVSPGCHIHIASTMSRPNALLRILARSLAGRGQISVSTNALHSMGHCLTMAGIISSARTAFMGDTVPSPRPNPLYLEVPQGSPFPVEETSLLSLNLQLMAGALGLPKIVPPALSGSDLSANLDSEGALLPLRPDITLVHAHCADQEGNLYFSGPAGEGVWGCLAAEQGVLATVETVVETPPEGGWSIPAQCVLGVAVCPLGAHPQGLPSFAAAGVDGYLDDEEFQRDLGEACADPDGGHSWYQSWVLGPTDHEEYLRLLGSDRVGRLKGALSSPVPENWSSAVPAGRTNKASYGLRELAIVVAAREIVDLIASCGYRSILTGIGAAHHAAWLAADLASRRGITVSLLTELGMVDYRPSPGDPLLFSQRHVARTRHHTGTLEVLGGMVAGRDDVLGVLSTAEVDPSGRLNSSRTPAGGYLVGSGGSNDIASTVDTVVVARTGTERFVAKAAFVTCPGERVCSVVSELGRFRRFEGGDFRLATWGGANVPTRNVAATEALRRTTSWPTRPFPDLEYEAQPTVEELELLRTLIGAQRHHDLRRRSVS